MTSLNLVLTGIPSGQLAQVAEAYKQVESVGRNTGEVYLRADLQVEDYSGTGSAAFEIVIICQVK